MRLDSFPTATFAGGCFWCLEADFLKLPGVFTATSGYTGGDAADATYEAVCSGETGHYEAVQVRFDPELVSYRALVDWFWRRIDPTDALGQFCDKGPQYRSAVFYSDADQERAAQLSLEKLSHEGILARPVVTQLLPAGAFYPAEDYHQDYQRKNTRRYQQYRQGCGRDATLERLWGPNAADVFTGYRSRLAREVPPEGELAQRFPPLAVQIIRHEGTEPPFDNAYWKEHRPGLYVDAVSGAPLFSSQNKFDSGTGWPSFTRALMPGNLMLHADSKLFTTRTEVRSWHSDSHLGHVFNDGPREAGGLRYCMNSASLRFVPVEELAAAGYERYLGIFA
jgi:peptide methionine sulfoxide reductase msrA/msrB